MRRPGHPVRPPGATAGVIAGPSRPVIVIGTALLLAGGGGGLTSCDRADPAVEAPEPFSQRVERGPVEVITTVDRPELTVGDTVQLTLEAIAEPGVRVQMPRLERTLGDFEIRSAHTPPDVPDGERRRWTHRYVLATFETGDLEIPAQSVPYVDGRNAGAPPVEGELTTEAFSLTVRSVLDASDDPAALLEIKDAVRVPIAGRLAWAWWAAGAAGLLASGWIIWWWRRRRAAPAAAEAPIVPPHVWARRELDRLAADGLLERGAVQAYYFRLSDIVRQYIERRFQVMAPERTTDEFLREAHRHPALGGEHRGRLADFLRSADMVKFARHEPAPVQSQEAFEAARSFVDRTAPVEADSAAAGTTNTAASAA